MNTKEAFKELDAHLAKVDRIFNIQNVLSENISQDIVKQYYIKSYWGYKYIHSRSGAIHMALNYDGVFDKNGYQEQARQINQFILENKTIKSISELGFGKGFNSIYLSSNNPDKSFSGVDLTPEHIRIAQAKSTHLKNLHLKSGDFNEIPFADESQDLVFEIESVCHARNASKVFKEIYRILKPGGFFYAFDGFRKTGFDEQSENLKIASALVEKSMAVWKLHEIDYWINCAKEEGFEIIECVDYSHAIMPNLLRLQKIAKAYFKYNHTAKIILKTLPLYLVRNSITGLLMPYTIQNNAQGYYKIVLQKK